MEEFWKWLWKPENIALLFAVLAVLYLVREKALDRADLKAAWKAVADLSKRLRLMQNQLIYLLGVRGHEVKAFQQIQDDNEEDEEVPGSGNKRS